jgi:hypothetical protein
MTQREPREQRPEENKSKEPFRDIKAEVEEKRIEPIYAGEVGRVRGTGDERDRRGMWHCHGRGDFPG